MLIDGAKTKSMLRGVADWSSWVDQLRYPPWRHRVLVALVVFPIVLGLVLALTLGILAGIAGFSTAFSIPAFFRHDLQPGPRLGAALITKSGFASEVGFAPVELRALDIPRIVSGSKSAARETAPDLPPDPKAGYEDFGLSFARFSQPLSSPFAPTREEIVGFIVEVEDYGGELESWLRRYEEVRVEAARRLRLTFRLENDGEAPAQNVRLRVRCPAGFSCLTKPLPIVEAPRQPRFKQPFYAEPLELSRSGALTEIGRRLTAAPPSGPVPIVSDEPGQLVLAFEIGHLNHGPDHIRTDPVTLLAPGFGDFELKWEALSANPGPAASGTLKFRLLPAISADPAISSLREVSEDQEACRIDEVSDDGQDEADQSPMAA